MLPAFFVEELMAPVFIEMGAYFFITELFEEALELIKLFGTLDHRIVSSRYEEYRKLRGPEDPALP